jgi:plastocyanin
MFVCGPAFPQDVAADATVKSKTGVIKGTINARAARYKKNTVVYIDHIETTFAPPNPNPVVDQKNLVFLPHILFIVKGTTVDFTNSDSVQHSIFSPSPVADKMNLGTYGPDQVKSWTFNKIGDAVLLCNVHAEMSAWVVVRQNPYFSITDKDGHFEIKDVPAGTYRLDVWNKKLSADSQEIIVKEGQITEVSFDLAKKRGK